ncbi:hypothetical protein OBBRIDRAFT_797345, partial [Obba rivulosa]
MALSLTEARILALFFTSICVGIHLVTLSMALWTLLVINPSREKRTNWLLVCASACMGIVGTLDISIDTALNIRVWTTGDLHLFTDVSLWMNKIKDADQCIQLLIGDAIMTYRCWVVFERRWQAAIVPLIIWTAACITSIIFVVRSASIDPTNGVNTSSLMPLTTSILSLTVALNVLCTSMITLRIWTISRSVRTYIQGHNTLSYVMRILIQSGVVYTAMAIVTLATIVAANLAVYITSDCLLQVTGITFNLIIVRFEENLTQRSAIESERSRSIPLSSLPSTKRVTTITPRPTVHIEVTRDTEMDKGSLSASLSRESKAQQSWSI